MTTDPLHTPLRRRGLRERLRPRGISPAIMAAIMVFFALGALVTWAWFAPPPEVSPLVVERDLPPRPMATTPSLGMAESAPLPAAGPSPEKQEEARVIRKGQAKIITLPDDPEAEAVQPISPQRQRALNQGNLMLDVRPLPPAPQRDLVQRTRLGPLPKVGRKGRQPWKVYARPVPKKVLDSPRPKLAVIVTDLGLDTASFAIATDELPPQVSLALVPYAKGVRALGLKARRKGHEFFIQLPMEPWGYPAVSPGPRTLLAEGSPEKNRRRLHWFLTRAVGYAGIITYAGQKMLQKGEALAPVLHELKNRGLMAVDDGTAAESLLGPLGQVIGLPALRADVRVPAGLKRNEVLALLERAEETARQRGRALLVVSAADSTALPLLQDWLSGIVSGEDILLVPATALAKLQVREAKR